MLVNYKKLFVCCVALFMVLSASADPITREQAQRKATEFLKTRAGAQTLVPVTNQKKLAPRRAGTAQAEPYYAFNRGQGQGYVLVAGDDKIETVLGYTDKGEFDYQALPDNMRSWLERQTRYIEYVQSHPDYVRAKVPVHPAITPMVKTTWNQGSPYNDECPMYFSLGRSVTGCVATAMAQVLFYQKDKSVTETQADMPAYDTWTEHPTFGKLHVQGIPAGSPIDWDNMLNSYNNGGTAVQKKAVADLMHYCGVSVNMDYTNTASGAQSYAVADAMNKYFGYTTARYVQQTNYNDEGWDALVYNELEQGRPLYLSGANSEAGHAFVCDGYDGNHCFHINWGWGGASDGYFLLNSLNPSSQGIGGSGDGYSAYEDAVIGCEPSNYGEKPISFANATVRQCCVEAWDTNGDGQLSYDEAASVTDLGTVFAGKKFTSFIELTNFTGLTSIGDSAFANCATLASIRFPRSVKHIGAYAFLGCRSLKTCTLPKELISMGKGALAGCRTLAVPELPSTLTAIADSCFAGCALFNAIELPLSILHVGQQAFAGCTKLTSFTTQSASPQNITLGENVFENINLEKATLYVQQGMKAYFAATDQWKDFGTIYEERTLAQGQFVTLETGKPYYIYNVGTGRYLTSGEAYGTQAVVANTTQPMQFYFGRSSSMPEGVYYITSGGTATNGHLLFRTSNDDNVGKGVKACFVDGGTSNLTSKSAYWSVATVEGLENVYTLQVPQGQTGYEATQYLGIQTSHASNAAVPTYGAYSDVVYADFAANCQWMLVPYDPNAVKLFTKARQLKNLLSIGEKKHVDTTREQQTYDNFDSTEEEMDKACYRLRRKLNFINFVDPATHDVIVSKADSDGDGEITRAEAAGMSNTNWLFSNSDVADLSDFGYFTGLTYLAGAFNGCTKLHTLVLPENIQSIYSDAATECKSLKTLELPISLSYLAEGAFRGCSSLTEVRIRSTHPENITIYGSPFPNTTLSKAVLYVPHGTKEAYANHTFWKKFGEIREMRTLEKPAAAPINTEDVFYVQNVGLEMDICKGEAYGTQAIVGRKGFAYRLYHTASMPDSVYYLMSSDTGTDGKVLFRTDTDTKVGDGVKACFVDGNLSAKAYWKLHNVGDNRYTLQVPENDDTYVEDEYLGINTAHENNNVSYTYGIYWDNKADEQNEANHLWEFIRVSDTKAEQQFYELTEQLNQLLQKAKKQSIDTEEEQAVYDNFDSTEQQIKDAIASLRTKLHYIEFTDTHAKEICLNTWDDDTDGELSYEEAAAVTDLGESFRNNTFIKSFDAFQHFTGLTSLANETFRGCTNLVSLYLPANIQNMGDRVFNSCSNFKYLAIPSTAGVITTTSTSLPRKLTVFVPDGQVEAFTANETWGSRTILPYTGIPTVTAEDTVRLYGRTNPKYTYVVTGAPIDGEPVLTCNPEATAPVGTYTIYVEAGTITTTLQAVNGTLTIQPAPLTISVNSYTRNMGEENPEFKVTYRGFRNNEREDVLTKLPVVECDATADSPWGEYEIRVSGAEAQNYEMTYVNGVLTVLAPVGINNIRNTQEKSATIYDLQGRRIATPSSLQNGVYIINGKKVTITSSHTQP